MKLWLSWIPLLIALGGCVTPSVSPSVALTPAQAARSETVTAQLTGLSAAGAQVFVGSLPAAVQSASGNTVVFTVPTASSGGPQVVRVIASGQTVSGGLKVLGDVSRTEVVVMVKAGVSEADFQARLVSLNLGLSLINFKPLNGPGPCAGAVARVGVPGAQPVGFVLDRLSQPDQADIVLYADPQSLWDPDLDHLGGVGAPLAHARGLRGAGVTIAVLDTGVTAHSQLGADLLAGFDFVDEDNQPADAFNDPNTTQPLDGHGTPVAILAAGNSFGVAPLAKVLPVRVGDSGGEILASNAIRGVCYALERVDNKRLVLNLSFGGDTPAEGLRVVLEYALRQKTLVAAAAGNQGALGSPTHYPAAFDLPGLVVVGALNLVGGNWTPAAFSTRGAYVDVAAPGQNLTSGNPAGTFAVFDGTSFAAPLVAGALALWREANPEATAEALEQSLKAAAKPVPGAGKLEVGSGLLDLSAKP